MTTTRASAAHTTSLLSRIKGPKLERFHCTAPFELEFVHYIGSEDDADFEVWKLRVDDKYYALKIVSQCEVVAHTRCWALQAFYCD
jgi:hypothetical protein